MFPRARVCAAAILVGVLLCACSGALRAGEQEVIDIFVDGKLAPGVTLENGRVEGDEIVTVPMGYPFGDSPFTVKGLDIDITGLDLAQIHVRVVATGGRDSTPTYAEIQVDTTSELDLRIEWFPFKSYEEVGATFMTKSCDWSQIYGAHPKGDDYGKITGLRVLIESQGGMEMRYSKLQVLIDRTPFEPYPDDPQPDPNWKAGKIDSVYAISGSQRVSLGELDSPLEESNTVWQDGVVKVSGARNEIVPFQVVMEVPAVGDGVNNVNVRYTGVRKGAASIDNFKAADPDDIYNYVGRPIQLYRARYISLADSEEYFPEMLIPFEAKWGGAPFSIFPGQTQSVWVDTYIPKDAEAGLYKGTADVLVGGEVVKSLPVELTVHDFALPNEPSVHSLMWGLSLAKHNVEGDALHEVAANYRRFLRRNYTGFFEGISRYITDEELQDPKFWRLRGGSIYTREEGYEGTGYGLPAPFVFFTMYGGGVNVFDGPGEFGDEESWHQGLLRWKKAVDEFAPGAVISWYAWDEPSHAFTGGLGAFVDWMNTVGPYVESFNEKYDADVKIYATANTRTARQAPSINIYQGRASEVDQMHEQGDLCARYNGPQDLGLPASALRVVGWQAYSGRVDIWWMFRFEKYYPGFDVYRDPVNFFNQYGETRAGVGSFVFPGTDAFIAKRNPGLDGPVPGIRFFNWRQGFIDYEYLALAAKKDAEAVGEIIGEAMARPQLERGLPRERRSRRYPTGDEKYVAAREKLVKIILGEPEN